MLTSVLAALFCWSPEPSLLAIVQLMLGVISCYAIRVLIDKPFDDPREPPPVTPRPSTDVSNTSSKNGCLLSQMPTQILKTVVSTAQCKSSRTKTLTRWCTNFYFSGNLKTETQASVVGFSDFCFKFQGYTTITPPFS